MRHFLAYGNSDQASFRNPEVRRCFDMISVPSTIASYYADATAAFVLSSGRDYFIEPRTPLFQEWIREPRASHYTLAAAMGHAVQDRLGPLSERESKIVQFPAGFYSHDVCDEVVASLISFQRDYGGRAEHISEKLNRYRSLLDRAQGGSGSVASANDARSSLYTNEAIVGLVPKEPEELLSEYLYYLLPFLNIEDYAQPAAKGNTLNKSILERLRIPMPPVSRQAQFIEAMRRREAEAQDLRERAADEEREQWDEAHRFIAEH